MSSQKRLVIRWTTLKGLAAIILFLVIVILVEYVVVLYAINLGVKDETQFRWSLTFPGTEWSLVIAISPLFHLVPVAVIVSLVFSWTCLTKYAAVKRVETQKEKPYIGKRRQEQPSKALKKFFDRIKYGLLKVKGIAYVWQKIHFARATIKSALTVLLVFSLFIVVASLLAHPSLIYKTITGAYRNNQSLLDFVKGAGHFFAPIGGFFSAVNDALLGAAPSFRDFALSIGSIISPLANLDNVGKYLAFQNIAAWISALSTLIYVEYRKKVYRYKKTRKG
ncbi:MAG: hypothetical protein OEY22_07945 [Candidatus Bathyarchaeota archaeon]|nr:hypothetical protein [Candidatus Bathyarchaeota archaeon]MDH5787560.1 hypothetical protein [Candidatus Bathyarchaeota archaeon]